ncbi:hypothetical protein N1851_010584 [Merluccius polli]|uniref:Uncharacterized protein n=1 Tax=Merluccius polli TaxID=89951 RepID=A0AA47MYH1_MERPO|nr:hypothetical protein N1851_010584 [Merluccius polli]
MHCFPLLRRRMVVQNLFEAVRKSFSMASPNSSHVRVFASVTATAALRLACRYLPAASGVPQAKKFDGIPHRRCPPGGSGIAATAGTDHLAATALVGRLNNGGVEHGPLGLNVPRLPRYMVKALPEVGVEALSDRRLCQTFPADPHDTFGSASSAPLFARVSKTCGRKSDDTTTKSIIELRPRVSWCQAQTTVRIRPPTRRRREATLSSTGVNSNTLAPSRGAISIATPARRLSPVATPEWKRVQPLSRRLVPEPLLCVEVRPTISSRNFSTSRTSSGSFPTREVTFHVPRASFCSRGSDRQGPRLRPPPSSHCTRPLWPLLLVVSRREGGPTSSFRAVPGRAPPGHQALAAEPHPQAWLQGEAPLHDDFLDIFKCQFQSLGIFQIESIKEAHENGNSICHRRQLAQNLLSLKYDASVLRCPRKACLQKKQACKPEVCSQTHLQISVVYICGLHIHDANLPFHHIPKVLYWIEIW